MPYVPNCADPYIQDQIRQGLLPSNLCDYPVEILQQICARQPSLCQPYPGAVQPSIWEPIEGTFEEVGTRILTTAEATGTGVLGTVQVANTLLTVLPWILIGGGIWYMSQRR